MKTPYHAQNHASNVILKPHLQTLILDEEKNGSSLKTQTSNDKDLEGTFYNMILGGKKFEKDWGKKERRRRERREGRRSMSLPTTRRENG
jgi:hypothetical protein